MQCRPPRPARSRRTATAQACRQATAGGDLLRLRSAIRLSDRATNFVLRSSAAEWRGPGVVENLQWRVVPRVEEPLGGRCKCVTPGPRFFKLPVGCQLSAVGCQPDGPVPSSAAFRHSGQIRGAWALACASCSDGDIRMPSRSQTSEPAAPARAQCSRALTCGAAWPPRSASAPITHYPSLITAETAII
jgi:hypothetical protein